MKISLLIVVFLALWCQYEAKPVAEAWHVGPILGMVFGKKQVLMAKKGFSGTGYYGYRGFGGYGRYGGYYSQPYYNGAPYF